MNILFIYETYSSTTETVAQLAIEELKKYGHTVQLQRLRDTEDIGTQKEYDLTILATPSWLEEGKEGQPHTLFVHFMKTYQAASFDGRLFALIGLGDSTFTHFCQAIDILEAFVKSHKGEIIIPTLKLDSFYFNTDEETKKLNQWLRQLNDKIPASPSVAG